MHRVSHISTISQRLVMWVIERDDYASLMRNDKFQFTLETLERLEKNANYLMVDRINRANPARLTVRREMIYTIAEARA